MKPPIRKLLTDPPWWYANRKTGGERSNPTKFGGGASKHYELMKDERLLELAPLIKAIMADDSACFMWATDPRKDFAIELVKAWGFRYVTEPFHWYKTTNDSTRFRYGPGSYTGTNHEGIILGVRGSMGEPYQKLMKSILEGESCVNILTPRSQHSRKPPIHRLIDRMFPGGRNLEMFSRRQRKGWDAIGNGVTGRDIKDDLAALALDINGILQPNLFEVS